jgi:hypothetical protein
VCEVHHQPVELKVAFRCQQEEPEDKPHDV